MYKIRSKILFVTALILPAFFHAATAQECVRAGLYNSPKGFGARADIPKDNISFHEFTFYYDIAGRIRGIGQTPGLRLSYSSCHILGIFEMAGAKMSVYAGPGVAAGYSHDIEKGYFSVNDRLSHNPGFTLGATGTIGCIADFSEVLSLSLSFTGEAGIHIRKDEEHPQTSLSFYKYGLVRTIYPELGILFNFGRKGAAAPRERHLRTFRYGIEWGASILLFNKYDFQYLNEDKAYVIDQGIESRPYVNGYVSAFFGWNASEKVCLSFHGGYAGIAEGRRVFPLYFRFTFYPKTSLERGFTAFADAGLTISNNNEVKAANIAGLGSGYHVPLSGGCSLDVNAAFKLSFDHPEIWDSADRRFVDKSMIRKDDALYGAVSLGIALNF